MLSKDELLILVERSFALVFHFLLSPIRKTKYHLLIAQSTFVHVSFFVENLFAHFYRAVYFLQKYLFVKYRKVISKKEICRIIIKFQSLIAFKW